MVFVVIGELGRFIAVGFLNTAVDFGLLNLLIYFFHWPSVTANTLSFSAAVLNSFFWNKYWTFGQRGGAFWRQFLIFVTVSLIGLGLSDLTIYLGHVRFGYNVNLIKAFSVVIVFLWNFLGYKYFAFRR